jgi:hypothetical protein
MHESRLAEAEEAAALPPVRAARRNQLALRTGLGTDVRPA